MICEVHAIALDAMRCQIVPVMVPGTWGGDPAIHLHGYPVAHFPQVIAGTTVERVRTLIAMTAAARAFATSAGMVIA